MAMPGRWHEKLMHYIEDANSFLVGVQIGQPSDGYSKDDIEYVASIASEYGLQLPNTQEKDSDYDAVTDFLPTLSASMDQLQIRRIDDIGQRINEAKVEHLPRNHKHPVKDVKTR